MSSVVAHYPYPRNTIAVFASNDFVVTEGEGVTFKDDLVLDDAYQLSPNLTHKALTYEKCDGKAFVVADDTKIGTPGNQLYLDCTITLMAPDGTTCEALVWVEVEGDEGGEVYLMPLASLRAEYDYRLVGADRDTAAAKFADVAWVRFARGTNITLASGAQIPIEDLKVGDRILTRDAGPQQIRWIGNTTLRPRGHHRRGAV